MRSHVHGPIHLGPALAQVFNLRFLADAAQLLLDGLHLLVQEVLALLLVKILTHLVGDLVLDLQHLLFRRQVLEHPVGARLQIRLLQQFLLFLHLNARHVAGNEVEHEGV